MAASLTIAREGVRPAIDLSRAHLESGVLIRCLRAAPGCLLCAALLYAPWDYGCTTERGIVNLNWILSAALALWFVDLLVARRLPRIPAGLVVLSLGLLGIGWWMALNAHSIYDSEHHGFIPVSNLLGRAPGSIDQAISVAWMIRATTLLGAACLVADLSQRTRWLLTLWWTIGIAGGSIALLGLLQKATAAPMIFWNLAPVQGVNTFFATYYYHANGGAFLNLTLPLTCGLALRTLIKPTSPLVRALWASTTVILLVATLANTSRMGQFISILLVVTVVVAWRNVLVRTVCGGEGKSVAFALVVVVTALLSVAQPSHLDQPLRRWQALAQQLPADARWPATQAALGAVHDAGWFGFGPGTFRVIFPEYTADLGDRMAGTWRFLHEDYLQTVLEWGWAGSALWAAFLLAGLAMALRNLHSPRAAPWSSGRRSFLSLAVLALLGVMLHALVDFPLQIASLQLYAAVCLGVCWGSSGWNGKIPSDNGGRSGKDG